MKDPSSPDASRFLIEPWEEYRSQTKSKKRETEYPPWKPGSKYRDMIEWEHTCTHKICGPSWVFSESMENDSSKEIFFGKRITEHNICKDEKKRHLIDMSTLHRELNRLPVNTLSQEPIGESYHYHWNKPKSHSIQDTCPSDMSESPNRSMKHPSEHEGNDKKRYNLLHHLHDINWMVDILRNIEENTRDNRVDEDEPMDIQHTQEYLENRRKSKENTLNWKSLQDYYSLY